MTGTSNVLTLSHTIAFAFYRRKSDIENERLPPELLDPEEAMPYLSNPSTPAGDGTTSTPGYPFPSPINTSVPNSGTTGRQDTPTGSTPTSGAPFRPRHGRQPSLGTTMTSPSNRRRSIESTISLIREASEGKGAEEGQLRQMAENIAGTSKPTYNYPAAAPGS